ncbi:N-acetylmuramyl-L-alanine amidase, negative regulator of AmpC, AmpD [Calothrix sp. NIES-4071]|nr:N-acetylmuramyl-L-alanine amidase, negative regulator of AmpC, AmpD [Calothrix sp. NIES-4071]BAZ59898.1 N-acetylmuramyl-L-alanine amidase, negative regulator of AmpC, AmpD [Calothrix sp. NIES-4105]
MRDSAWITRMLAISLVVLGVIVFFVGSKDVKSSDKLGNSHLSSEQTAWSPAKVQYQSDIKPPAAQIPNKPVNSQPAQTNKPQTASPKLAVQPNNTQAASPKAPVQKTNAVSKQPPKRTFTTTYAFKSYTPKYVVAWADPSNYGDRFATDINGMPVSNQPIIVLHETSNSAQSAVNTFRTNNSQDENKQVSYHTLIARDGLVVYLVPPDKRAFGAGNSIFDGLNGPETVQTNPTLNPSVNNFAYHVSLETPPDAWNKNVSSHSGYTEEQYESLAWLVAQSDVPDERITTHRAVDRSGQRIDPVSFDMDKFYSILHSFRELAIN